MNIQVMSNKITSNATIRDVVLMVNNKEIEVLYWLTLRDDGVRYDGFEILEDEPSDLDIEEKQAILRILRSKEINQ